MLSKLILVFGFNSIEFASFKNRILHYLETSSNSINTLAKALSGHGQAPLSELNMQDTLLSVLEDMTGKGEV